MVEWNSMTKEKKKNKVKVTYGPPPAALTRMNFGQNKSGGFVGRPNENKSVAARSGSRGDR